MTALFNSLNSGEIKSFYGRVSSTKAAAGKFEGFVKVSVAVETGYPKGAAQYNPSIFIDATTSDESIEKGDKVVIQGMLKSREYNDKTYYELNPFCMLPIVVVEKAGQGAPAATTKSAAVTNDVADDDF